MECNWDYISFFILAMDAFNIIPLCKWLSTKVRHKKNPLQMQRVIKLVFSYNYKNGNDVSSSGKGTSLLLNLLMYTSPELG